MHQIPSVYESEEQLLSIQSVYSLAFDIADKHLS